MGTTAKGVGRLIWLGCILWAGCALFGCSAAPKAPANASINFPLVNPSTGWVTSTPEEQGMDSTYLANLLGKIQEKKLALHSLLVIRNGVIVTEVYLPPLQADISHDFASCGKSINSALVGIAIDQGLIKGLDQKMVDLFADRAIANMDDAKQAITLQDMLTMSAGLDWDEWRPADAGSSAFQMQQSRDAVQFVLDRKMAYQPGEHWSYSEGLFNLLSTVVSKSSGMSTPAFAQKYLLDPLDIHSAHWRTNPGGGFAVSMTPRDAAKFAFLYRNQGAWNGKQVIPAAWVKDSTTNHIQTGVGGKSYGYQWWLPASGGYAAEGDGGQRILVIPEKNLIVIFTAGLGYPDMETLPETLVDTYILPAVKSSQPLPGNKAAVAHLNSLIQDLAKPHPQPIPSLPAAARRISGKTYILQANSIGMEKFTLVFNGQEAEIELGFGGRTQKMGVGLDNVYLINPVDSSLGPIYGWMAFRGAWEGENTFKMDLLMSGLARRMIFTFQDDRVLLQLLGSRGEDEKMPGQAGAGK